LVFGLPPPRKAAAALARGTAMSSVSDLYVSLEHLEQIEHRLLELIERAVEAEEHYRDAVSTPSTLTPPRNWYEALPVMGLA
jgi:hypothetical protein